MDKPWFCGITRTVTTLLDPCSHASCLQHPHNARILAQINFSNNLPKNSTLLPKPPQPVNENSSSLFPCLVNNCDEGFLSIDFLSHHLRDIHNFSQKFLDLFSLKDVMRGGGGEESVKAVAGGRRPTVHAQGYKTVWDQGKKYLVCEHANCSVRRESKRGIESHIRERHW